jgi:hypothetical protein
MLKSSTEKSDATNEALQASPQGEPPRYIFSDETFQALLAIGEVLRRVHNRLEIEKAAAIGANSPNNVNMEK